MENRANYAFVGLFTLAVIAGAFGFVYWFKRAGEAGDRKGYQVVFSGSVSGLSKGSAVRFNGLRVGEVTSIEIMPTDPGKVVATIDVDRNTPIKTDTRARLESQGLTGVASVQLSGGAGDAPDIDMPTTTTTRPVIFADRSDYQDILETFQRLSSKLDTVLTRADTIIASTEGSFVSTVRNVEAFSKALADNSSGVAAFLSNVGEMSQNVSSLSQRIERFVDSAESLVRAVDAPTVNRAIGNIAAFSEALGENKGNVSSILSDGAALTKQLSQSAAKLDTALADISALAKAVDAGKLNRTLDGAEKFASALGKNADTIDQTIRDVSAAAKKLENVMAGAEKFLGGGEGNNTAGMMTEITEAAKAIRVLAANLDKRTAEMTAGINRFTGPGMRDIEALTGDARKAVGDISRAVRNLEKNPQQLLFGGRSSIPEYRR